MDIGVDPRRVKIEPMRMPDPIPDPVVPEPAPVVPEKEPEPVGT